MAQSFERSRNNEMTEVKTEPVEIKSDVSSAKEVNENYDDFAKKEIGEERQDVKTETDNDDEDYDNCAKEETGENGREVNLETDEDDEDYDNCAKVEASESGQEVKSEADDSNDEDDDNCSMVETSDGVQEVKQEFSGKLEENQETAAETNMENYDPDGSEEIDKAEGEEPKKAENAESSAAEVITENVEPENPETSSEGEESANAEGNSEGEETRNTEGNAESVEPVNPETNSEGKESANAEGKPEGEGPRNTEGNAENVEPKNPETNSEGKESANAEGNPEGEGPRNTEDNAENVEPEKPEDNSEGEESANAEGNPEGKEARDAEGNAENIEPENSEDNSEGEESANVEGNPEGEEPRNAEGNAENVEPEKPEDNSKGEGSANAEGNSEGEEARDAEGNAENVEPEDNSEGEESVDAEGNLEGEKYKNTEGDFESNPVKNTEGDHEGDPAKKAEGDTEGTQPNDVQETPSGNCPRCGNPIDQCTCTPDGEDAPPDGNCPRCGNPIDQCTCHPDGGEEPSDGGDVPPEDNCPRCGKNPCACNSFEQSVGKQINKLEDLTPQEIAQISQTEEGRQYIKDLHAEMAERVSAENMNMTVDEYRDYKRMSPEYKKQLQEAPPPERTQVELDAASALESGRAMHQKFHERSTNDRSDMTLRGLNNQMDSHISKMNEQLGTVNQALERANQEVDFMRSNALDLKDTEAYAQAMTRQENLDTLARHLRTQIATLDADMYDCARATDRPYRGSIRPMDEQERQKTLDEARHILHDGVEKREEVANALRLAEKIQFKAKPELDQKRREAESVIFILENGQQRYLNENRLTHEEALQDKNSEYARNDAYLKNLRTERDQIHDQIVEMDRLENNLRTGLKMKDSGCTVEIKDPGNGTLEIAYTWQDGMSKKNKETKGHSTESKFYFDGTERKESYIVGRDDDTLYGHKYSVQYRGVGYEREDTFKRGETQLKTQVSAGFLNGKMGAGFETDIETGKTKASLDAALCLAEIKGQLSTVVKSRESRLIGGEFGVGTVGAGITVDEKHGIALESPEASLASPKVQVAMFEMDGSNPLAMPESVPEAFTKMHDIREKTEELQQAAKKQWGEDVSGKTVVENKAPLKERVDAALQNDKASYADLEKLKEECTGNLTDLKALQQQAEKDSSEKFNAVFNHQKGTAEYKQALAEYNASRERKDALSNDIKQMEAKHANLAKRSEEVREKEAAKVQAKSTDDAIESKYRKTEEDAHRFGNCEVGERGFIKGENYDQFIKDWHGYSADRYKTEMFEEAKVQTIAPSKVEGISLSDYDLQNPDKFWSMHESGGTAESFREIANNIPAVQARLDQGESLLDLVRDPQLGKCAAIYFHPDNMPRVIKCGDYYEFQENGRHRILAAREAGYDIPVQVVGERTIEGNNEENSTAMEQPKENSLMDGVRNFFSNIFGLKDSRGEVADAVSDNHSLDNSFKTEGNEGDENNLKERLDKLATKIFSELSEADRQELVNIMLDNMKQRYGDRIPAERYERIRDNINFLTGQEAIARGDIKPNEVLNVLGYYKPDGDEIIINTSADDDVHSILATLDHEAMHMATEKLDGSYLTGLKTNDANIRGRNVGMNEGLTEMYSIRNMQELNPSYKSNSYKNNVMVMEKFESVVGAELLHDAYMNNDVDGLRATIDAKMGAGSFNNFCNLMDSMHNDYSRKYYADGDVKRDQLLVMLDGAPSPTDGETKRNLSHGTYDSFVLKETSERRQSGRDMREYAENPLIAEGNENVVRALGKVRAESLQIDYSQREGRDALSEQEKITIERQLDRVFAECNYCIRIKAAALCGVFTSGEFYSQTNDGYEDKTNGSKAPEKRRELSEYHFGQVMNEKYGYASRFQEEMKEAGKEKLDQYGHIIVSFKKEAVEGRMTYYLGDSLAAYKKVINGDDPHLGVVGGENGGTTLSGALVKYYQDILETAQSGEMDPFAYVADGGYLEIQYLGKLGIEDIDSIGFLNEKAYHDFCVELPPDKKELLVEYSIDIVIRQPDGSLKHVELSELIEESKPVEQSKPSKWNFGKWFRR